ncbi:MAG: ATP-binding protein [Microbacterium sp.]
MTAAFDVSALGARVRLQPAEDLDPQVVARVRASWADAILTDGGEPDATVPIPSDVDAELMAERLTVNVTLAALGHRRGELVMFHAAGVADERGRVAAFVGPSGRGKTTLSRALGQEYGYVSDESIGVAPDLEVLPYRKPLSLVRKGAPKEQVAPSAFGVQGLPDAPLRLSALAILDRDADLDAPVIERVGLCDAVAELVPQMSYFPELSTPLQALAGMADRIGGLVHLRYPDATKVAPLIPELLDRADVAEPWEPVPAGVAEGPYDDSAVVDAVRVGDRTVVLTARRIQVLDGIAPTVWDAVRTGNDLDGIVAQVVEEFGEPEGDPRELVGNALDALIDEGILSPR